MTLPRLNREVVLEDPQRMPDGSGGFAETWVPLGTFWAEIRTGFGRESAADLMKVSTLAFRITVRAAPPGAPSRPRPEQRFREGSRLFRILAVAERDPAGTYLTCFAEEEVVA